MADLTSALMAGLQGMEERFGRKGAIRQAQDVQRQFRIRPPSLGGDGGATLDDLFGGGGGGGGGGEEGGGEEAPARPHHYDDVTRDDGSVWNVGFDRNNAEIPGTARLVKPAPPAESGPTIPAAPRYPGWVDTPLDPAGPNYDWDSPNAFRPLPVDSDYGRQAMADFLGVSQPLLGSVQAALDADLITTSIAQEILGVGGGGASSGSSGGSGSGGGSPYADLYAGLAVRQQEEAEKQAYVGNLLDLIDLAERRQAQNAQLSQNTAQLQAQLAPYMTGGREYYGGFEPYGAAAAVAAAAGVPFTPRPIQTMSINTGAAPQQESDYEALLRQYLGV